MKTEQIMILSLGLFTGACTQKESLPPVTQYEGYELVWAEEFNTDGMPDTLYWGFDEGYLRNNELQDYKAADPKYARVENGTLILEAFKDPHDGVKKRTGEPWLFEFSSAEVKSLKTRPMKYGRVDVSARIPVGRGVWPAIWMMSLDNKYGGWPHSGEIDIMEYVWDDSIHNHIYSTIHTADTNVKNNYQTPGIIESETLDTAFHLYSLLWDEEKLEILFDNQVIYTFNPEPGSPYEIWPFDQPFYLILNIAVGGDWGGIWGIDDSIFPARMEIDYVRYYQRKQS